MADGILSLIGNTPLIPLTHFFNDADFSLFAKLEGLNPGGSIKDRAALNILENGMASGQIGPHTVVIESSSGNMGIGLAQACAYLGLRFICVVDPKTTPQNVRILESYGAEVDLVSNPDAISGEYLQARINRVKFLLSSIEDSFWPDQYSSLYNSMAHHRTMSEVAEALNHQVDYLFCATSTCGTLRGCSEYIRDHGMSTQVLAVDAIGSIIFGGQKAKRLIPGHGAAVRPALYQSGLADRCIHVSDLDCIVGCRKLVQKEAILAGGSSGAVLMALDYFKQDIHPGSVCVVILPDRGERYLDTIYSDAWVKEHFGDVFHLWQPEEKRQECTVMI